MMTPDTAEKVATVFMTITGFVSHPEQIQLLLKCDFHILYYSIFCSHHFYRTSMPLTFLIHHKFQCTGLLTCVHPIARFPVGLSSYVDVKFPTGYGCDDCDESDTF
jgi:hypothetical protein